MRKLIASTLMAAALLTPAVAAAGAQAHATDKDLVQTAATDKLDGRFA